MKGIKCSILAVILAAAPISCIHDTMKREQLEMRSRLEHAIADVDLELDRVKREAEGAIGASREQLDAQSDKLEDVKSDLTDKWDRVGDTTADEWDAFRLAVDRSLENTTEILKEVKQRS
jgi:hypothetical protein